MAVNPDSDGPAFAGPTHLDTEMVLRVLGKRLLVGLTYVNDDGDLLERRQFHGLIERITEEAGIVIRLADGATYSLPPDLRGIQPAPPGTYRLKSTGEELNDPDFLYTWTITRPDA